MVDSPSSNEAPISLKRLTKKGAKLPQHVEASIFTRGGP